MATRAAKSAFLWIDISSYLIVYPEKSLNLYILKYVLF